MTPATSQRGAFFGGLLGIIGGGLTWIVLSGLVTNEILLWGPPILLGVGLAWLANWAYGRSPGRANTILGATLLCVTGICAVYLVPVFTRIPDRLCVTTGKSLFIVPQLGVFLAVFAVLGVAMIVRDLRLKR